MKNPNPRCIYSRSQKQELLPQIAQLAQEGLTYREIGEKLGLPRSTVGRWLRGWRRESAAKKPPDPAAAIRKKIAWYESISKNLLEGWRLSQAEKQVRLFEQSGPAGDPAAAKEKRSIRTENRTGNAAYLTRAIEVENHIDALEQRLAALEGSEPGGCPASLANLTDEDFERLTPDDLENFNDDQLFTIESRLRAKYERQGVKFARPLLTNEDLRKMSDAKLALLEASLQAELAAAATSN